MRHGWIAIGGMLLLGAGSPSSSTSGERVVSGDGIVPVTINGHALRLRIEPSAPGLPLVAPALAPALGLKKPGFFGFGVAYRIGRETVYGNTQVARVGWGDAKPEGRRIGWMSRAYQPAADGTIGPGGLPEPVVRFALRAPRAGERVKTLAMQGGTGLFGSWFVLDGAADVDGTPLRIRLDPHHARTLANASAAVALARARGGVMTAETGRQEIVFGVERPYRVMKLARALTDALPLDRIGVRVTDGDVAGRIAEEGAPDADPDEVVVTAKGKRPRPALLILGADALAACSSITFDKPARQVRLSCGG